MSRMSSSCKFLLKRKIYQTKVPFFTGRALLLLVQKVFCAIFWEKPSIGTESPLCLGAALIEADEKWSVRSSIN